MNRSELRALVIEHTGRSDKTSLINSMLDEAVRKVSSEHLWNDMLVEASAAFTIGVSSLALAADVRRLSELRVMDGLSSYQLELRNKTWLTSQWADFNSQALSKPRFGYLQGTTLFVVPPPDLAYPVQYSYYRLHPKLTAETSSVLISQADEAVVAYTTYRVFKSLQQHEDAAQWLADYAMLLHDAKSVDRSSAIKQFATPRGMGEPVPEDYWVNPFVKETP